MTASIAPIPSPLAAAAGSGAAATIVDLREAAEAHRVTLVDLPPLTSDESRLVENTWRGRMVNEHASARVFGALLGQAMAAGVSAERQAELLDFAGEELRHARLCAGVLASLGFDPVGSLPPLVEVPRHEDASPLEGFLRNVLSVCCLSETCATALISAERLEHRGGPIGAVLEDILADEVGHARFGWKLLEDTPRSAPLNQRLGAYLAVAFGHLEAHELAHLSPHAAPAGAAARGACDGPAARAIFRDTVEQVIVPRLEEHGISARRAWQERGLPDGVNSPCASHPESISDIRDRAYI